MKEARAPTPSAKAAEPLPAIVVTTLPLFMARMRWLPRSLTKMEAPTGAALWGLLNLAPGESEAPEAPSAPATVAT